MTKPGIYGKILKIQQTLEVEKNGYDERQDFYYYKADDVAKAMRKSMNEHGVIHRTEIHETREDNKWDQNGRNRPRISVTGSIIFIDPDDGSEFRTDVVATGSDTGGDKAPRKLHVQMFKVAAVDIFKVTDEFAAFDSDGDKESEPINMNQAPPAEKAKTLNELVARVSEITKDESNAVDGKQVGAIGNKIAKELGFEQKSAVWRKQDSVMVRVVAELEEIVAKTHATGEVS